jgi:dynamin GTPase
LPGILDKASERDDLVTDFAGSNDAILLVALPAQAAPGVANTRVLRFAQELDPDGSRTVGVLTRVDQAAGDARALSATTALLQGQGPGLSREIPWVATITKAQADVSADESLQGSFQAELDMLRNILGRGQLRLGRAALIDTLFAAIKQRTKQRIPTLLAGLEGKSAQVEEELVRLGERRATTSEGHRAVVLEMAREFEDTFIQHIESGEVGGAKMVSSFETSLPQRIRRLPLDDLFELAAIKKLVEEADGYQPYLLSPEKGLRALVKKCLDLAKPPSIQCVDEVHRTLLEVVSAAAAVTPGLSRYPPLRRHMVELASAALDSYRGEAKTMVVALVDMERSFIHPTKFRKLMQRRLEKLAYEEDLKDQAKAAEQSLLSKITGRKSTSEGKAEAKGASLKEQKDAGGSSSSKNTPPSTPTKEANSTPTGFVSGQEMIAGYLWKKSSDSNSWSKRWFVLNGKIGRLAYMKKPEDKYFRGVVKLEECIIEELVDKEDLLDGPDTSASSLSDNAAKPGARQVLKSNSSLGQAQTLAFRITNKTPYKSVVKVHNSLLLRAENPAEKQEWVSKMRTVAARASGAKEVESDADSGYDNEAAPAAMAPPVRAVRPSDPDAELRLMGAEVRDYVDSVLENLAANIPKAVVFCQIERAKETLLNKLYSGISAQADSGIDALLQEDGEVRQQREKYKQQNDALKKLQRQLSMQEAKVAIESGPDPGLEPAEDTSWRAAFREAGQENGLDTDAPPSPASNGPSLPKSRLSRDSTESQRREAPAPPQVLEPQPAKSKSRWGF